jgi:hypothetical protein
MEREYQAELLRLDGDRDSVLIFYSDIFWCTHSWTEVTTKHIAERRQDIKTQFTTEATRDQPNAKIAHAND